MTQDLGANHHDTTTDGIRVHVSSRTRYLISPVISCSRTLPHIRGLVALTHCVLCDRLVQDMYVPAYRVLLNQKILSDSFVLPTWALPDETVLTESTRPAPRPQAWCRFEQAWQRRG